MNVKLNQVIAIEKGTKSRVQADVDKISKDSMKAPLFEGFAKTFKPNREDGEQVPAERQHVQLIATRALKDIANRWRELFDVTAQKEYANGSATADLEVNGQALMTGVPVTYLLFLEKQLTDLQTIIGRFPTLDPAERWTLDNQSELYKTEPSLKTRTKKVQKPLVLYPHSAEHPAQTQLITEDESVGVWEHVRMSGALPESQQRRLLARVELLLNAVKSAREKANMIDAPHKQVGELIFNWVFQE